MVGVSGSTSSYEIKNSVISGDKGNDTLFIGGTAGAINTSSIYGGNSALTTGTGDDLISIQASITNSLVNAGDGADTINITGAVNNSTIVGAESLTVGALTSTSLAGGSGTDTIARYWSCGSSTVDGAAGNDSIAFSAAVHHFIR